jgi:hypothetical protein
VSFIVGHGKKGLESVSLEEIAQSPHFAISSFVTALLGLIAAYTFFRRSKRERRPYYSISQQTIIQNKKASLPGLSIHFHGAEQERITVVDVAFWNRGRETIRDVDVATADKLRIVVAKDAEVLDVRILTTCDDANQCSITDPEKNKDGGTAIPLEFEYLDQNEGLVVQVVHNGSQEHQVTVQGKVKGASILHDGSNRLSTLSVLPFPWQYVGLDVFRATCGFASIMSLVMGVTFTVMGVVNEDWLAFMVAAFLFLISWMYYSFSFRNLIPKTLQKNL